LFVYELDNILIYAPKILYKVKNNKEKTHMKLDILAVGVHPDDVEISCAGTILHHLSLGHKVGLLDLTAGELGTRGSAEIRKLEAEKASELLGIHIREALNFEDGFFSYKPDNLLEIIKIIRKYRPEIILANSLSDRHPDHGRAAKIVSDAAYYSGLVKIETNHESISQESWRPKAVYHYIQDYNLKPDFVFDITGYMDRKIEVIMSFKSQFYNPDSDEPETPISSKEFLEFIKSKARTYGRASGFEFAEGFNVNRTIGIKNLFDLY
jgi:bacillithiol biosynthesis deacetylase BshB1